MSSFLSEIPLHQPFPPHSTRRMVLSGRQREELNKAIAEYLGANGYLNTLNEFQKEADLNSGQDVEKKFVGKIMSYLLSLLIRRGNTLQINCLILSHIHQSLHRTTAKVLSNKIKYKLVVRES